MQAYFMLDEMLIAGELQEPSKKVTRYTNPIQPLGCMSACQAASAWLVSRRMTEPLMPLSPYHSLANAFMMGYCFHKLLPP